MTVRPRRFLFLEPFFGGSHRDFALGLKAHSRHSIQLVTLPARFWKWRMRGAALYFSQKINNPDTFDGLILTSLMSLSDLKALWGHRCPPALVYFHENQLNYPLAPGETMDYHYGFTNLTTALAARRLLFNSRTHMTGFLEALPAFLRMMPDCRPNWIIPAIAAKAGVAYPGCHFQDRAPSDPTSREHPPLIIWNHRWEHDKNPEAFFSALGAMQRRKIDFQVALLGQSYAQVPAIFDTAREMLGRRLIQYGHVDSRRRYYQWLRRGAIVISTALQENFGLAVVEAMGHGCLPLLPDRLCYPEILPAEWHADHLYQDQQDLEEKLAGLLLNHPGDREIRRAISNDMARFAWERVIDRFDQALDELAQRPWG